MAEHYEFTTVWQMAAPVETVWDEIADSSCWPEWWPGVRSVEKLRDGDVSGVGARYRSTWKSALPYTLVFESETVRVERPHRIEVRAVGELDGHGVWTLTAEGEAATRVRYDWRVRTTKSWMNLLAPVARPLFRWNHDYLMRRGGEGLARRLAGGGDRRA